MRHLAAILLLWATQAAAQTNHAGFYVTAITNVSGLVVSNVSISKIDSDSVCYTFSEGLGGGRILFSDMAESERPLFGYNPTNAAKATAERKLRDSQMAAQLASQTQAIMAQQQAQQVRTELMNGRRLIQGKVLQKLDDGLLVSSGADELAKVGQYEAHVYHGEVTTSHTTAVYEGDKPGGICLGLVYLEDFPKFATVTDDDYITVTGYLVGSYTYTTVQGAKKTVRKFSANLEKSVANAR